MAAYFVYVLKVSICIIVFYIFYILLLRNCTFFLLNRLYLILGILLSFVVPLLHFSIFSGQSTMVFSDIIHPLLIEPEPYFYQDQNFNANANLNYSKILSVIYFSGISVLFFKLLLSVSGIIRISINSEKYQLGKKRIVKVDSILPFSFFNLVFLPKNENNQMIIGHELSHIRQLHWLDLLIMEIVSVLLWFNPFVILYKSSLKLQHEYLADKSAIKENIEIENYLACMLKQIQVDKGNGLICQFYCKTIKKRIVMLTKNKTSVKYLGLYFLVLPLVCFMLFAFSSNKNSMANTNDVSQNVSNKPSICPVDLYKVKGTMGYGERMNPVTRKNDFHRGMDFAIQEGENFYAPAVGLVLESGFETKLGNYLLIKHDDEYSTFYAHFKNASVKVGDKISTGQVLGITGNTGTFSTGPHLHYEVIKNGERVDPKDYMPE